MSTPIEHAQKINKYLKKIKLEQHEHRRISENIIMDQKNIQKAKDALVELPKRIDRQKHRLNEIEKGIEGMENNIRRFLEQLKSITQEDTKNCWSPNPLVDQQSSHRIYDGLINIPEIKEILDKTPTENENVMNSE